MPSQPPLPLITPCTQHRDRSLGKDLIKLFKVLRQRTAQGGASFGRVIDGDLRVTEFGSWLQHTKADYYLQRLSVTHPTSDARPTAKAQRAVRRARDALLGEGIVRTDDSTDDLDARMEMMTHELQQLAA